MLGGLQNSKMPRHALLLRVCSVLNVTMFHRGFSMNLAIKAVSLSPGEVLPVLGFIFVFGPDIAVAPLIPVKVVFAAAQD